VPRKLLFVVNVAWFFQSHRLPIAIAAKRAGYEVHVACSAEDRKAVQAILDAGCFVHDVPFSRGKLNPMREILTMRALLAVYRDVRPSIVHHVTIKPVLYGSLLARVFRIPAVVNAISGLGHTFSNRGWLSSVRRHLIRLLYRGLLARKNSKIIFQNPNDLQEFVDRRIVPVHRTVLIRGSGVDLSMFRPTSSEDPHLRVLFPARMLWDKGVAEFVDSAKLVRDAGISAEFLLAGPYDPENPGHVPERTLRSYSEHGNTRWIGNVVDIAQEMGRAAVICLPSYYGEGVPKALIEAAACGKPIVTTDMPGCREVVREGWNGLLVPCRDSVALANALILLLTDSNMREQFGKNSRQYAEQEFGLEPVVSRTIAIYEELLGDQCES
jgi:glycosyltransferase involved in cell wall biosynthesis